MNNGRILEVDAKYWYALQEGW